MTESVSVCIPTRTGRHDYLAVALGSIAAQANDCGAELVVVLDDLLDSRTARLADRHNARLISHGARRGINVSRNTALEVVRCSLVCFLDDDVEAWPNWLNAVLEGASSCPSHDVFGGPIRGRLEGTNLRACGRESLPFTTLDLGQDDRDADMVWGANMTLRYSAVERIGPFDPALSGAGDEEDWLRRLRASGGRIRYLARAGVDHRRAGRDAKLPQLARSGYERGRESRRYDIRKRSEPSLARELRTLAGCIWHIGRYRCANGALLAAHTSGRIHEALRPQASKALD